MNNLERLQVAVHSDLSKKCCIRKYKRNQLDLLDVSQQHETNGDIQPTIVVLEGHDGGIEHAVTVYGSWVFDSNVNVALPLTRKTLDWCVMGKYVAVHEAIRFFLPISKLERKRKKQKIRKKKNIKYYECSAKTGENINNIFNDMSNILKPIGITKDGISKILVDLQQAFTFKKNNLEMFYI